MSLKISDLTETGVAPTGSYMPIALGGANYKVHPLGLGGFTPVTEDSDVMEVLENASTAGFSGTVSLTPPAGKKFALLSCTIDADGSSSGGDWYLVIGKNLDTDLPVGTYPAGSGQSYTVAQRTSIREYMAAMVSCDTSTELNVTDTNTRYVYVGDGGTVSIPWRVLIHTGPSGSAYISIMLVGWA